VFNFSDSKDELLKSIEYFQKDDDDTTYCTMFSDEAALFKEEDNNKYFVTQPLMEAQILRLAINGTFKAYMFLNS
jgi:hypothetical protein